VENAKFRRVLTSAEIPEGKMREVEIDGRSILVCRAQGALYALDNICTHANAKLHEGRLRGFRIICPLHGASFDCRSGAVLAAPATQALKVHPIRSAGESIEVEISS
jgi:nitrite reductase/ring-hydroxylating ferredoxin subunit